MTIALLDPRLAPAVQEKRGGLRLAEGPVDDGVTARRVELKFAVRGADLHKLRGILASNCRRLVYNQPVSQVNSIYFDDHALAGARENQNGADHRTKVRLRWYDSPEPDRRAYLEVKHRRNRIIDKQRFVIESQTPMAELPYVDLLDELARVLPPQVAEMLRLRPDPVLISSYNREHFAAADSTIRITLDSEIVTYDQAGLCRPRRRFGVPLRDLVVVEGKAPCGFESELRALLHPLRLRVTRNSKYVQGCQALGFASGTVLEDD